MRLVPPRESKSVDRLDVPAADSVDEPKRNIASAESVAFTARVADDDPACVDAMSGIAPADSAAAGAMKIATHVQAASGCLQDLREMAALLPIDDSGTRRGFALKCSHDASSRGQIRCSCRS
jgi:hypothetical protein